MQTFFFFFCLKIISACFETRTFYIFIGEYLPKTYFEKKKKKIILALIFHKNILSGKLCKKKRKFKNDALAEMDRKRTIS